MEHEYYSQVIIEDSDDQFTLVEENEKGSDELLIDAVRGYPHLYNPTLKEYKDIKMKENSWTEIASVMNMTVENCQTRWLRLRERFTKEQRLQETESRSGSGASHRSIFNLYNHMLFLKNHIKRRKSFTNVKVPTKKIATDISLNKHPSVLQELNRIQSKHIEIDKHIDKKIATNISMNKHPNVLQELNRIQSKHIEIDKHIDKKIATNISMNKHPSVLQELNRIQSKYIEIDKHIDTSNSSRLQDEQNQLNYIPQEVEYDMDNIYDMQQDTTLHDHIPQESDSNGNSNKLLPPPRNESRNSQADSLISSDSLSSFATHSKKSSDKINKNKTYLESSLAALSDTLKNHLVNKTSHPNKNEQNIWQLNTLTPEKSFGLLVATELERMPEPEKTKRKQAIANILWKPMQ